MYVCVASASESANEMLYKASCLLCELFCLPVRSEFIYHSVVGGVVYWLAASVAWTKLTHVRPG